METVAHSLVLGHHQQAFARDSPPFDVTTPRVRGWLFVFYNSGSYYREARP